MVSNFLRFDSILSNVSPRPFSHESHWIEKEGVKILVQDDIAGVLLPHSLIRMFHICQIHLNVCFPIVREHFLCYLSGWHVLHSNEKQTYVDN